MSVRLLTVAVLLPVAFFLAHATTTATLPQKWRVPLEVPTTATLAAFAVLSEGSQDRLATIWCLSPSARNKTLFFASVGAAGTLQPSQTASVQVNALSTHGMSSTSTTFESSTSTSSFGSQSQQPLEVVAVPPLPLRGSDIDAARLCWAVTTSPTLGCFDPNASSWNVSLAAPLDVVSIIGLGPQYVVALAQNHFRADLVFATTALGAVTVVQLPNSTVGSSLPSASGTKFPFVACTQGPVCVAALEDRFYVGLSPDRPASQPLPIKPGDPRYYDALQLPNGTGGILRWSTSSHGLISPWTGADLSPTTHTAESFPVAICAGRWLLRMRTSITAPALSVFDLLGRTRRWPAVGPELLYTQDYSVMCDAQRGAANSTATTIAAWIQAPGVNSVYFLDVASVGKVRSTPLSSPLARACAAGAGYVVICDGGTLSGLNVSDGTTAFTISHQGTSVAAEVPTVAVLPRSKTLVVLGVGGEATAYALP